MKLVFATNNAHKLEEIKSILGDTYEIISLDDIGFKGDIPEEKETLEENALDKARYIKENFGYDCFADDTGLEIEALFNQPGVYSARYAGPAKDAHQNMKKVLEEMQGIENRKARFRTVIALIIGEKELYFEGIVKGKILHSPKGNEGFGYDPIFKPEGYNLSFAEMPLNEKNKISHRARAVEKLIKYLKEKH